MDCTCGHEFKKEELLLAETFQVFDLPQPELEITEYQIYNATCPRYGLEHKGATPEGVNAPGRNDNGASNRTCQMGSHQKSENESVSAHASIEEIAKMAAASDAKTMVLTHLGNQPANAGATAKRYAELGYKCKVVIAACFLTITLDGEIFTPPEKHTHNTSGQFHKGYVKSN